MLPPDKVTPETVQVKLSQQRVVHSKCSTNVSYSVRVTGMAVATMQYLKRIK